MPVSRIPYGKRPKTLPVVRSVEEVARFLAAVADPKIRMLLRTIYACGLRLGETLRLTASSIDSRRMTHRDRGKRLAKCRELLGLKAATDNDPSTTASAKPPLLLALLFAAMVTMGTPSLVWKALPHPVETCRKCGGSDVVPVWQGTRPSGQRWREVNPWNSS